MPQRRPTSEDVARAAGVSRATVSYVLNGVQLDRISQDTQARVRASAEKLGYRPNAAAKTLRKGTSDIVLLSFPPWPLGPVIADSMSSWVRELAAIGYRSLLHLEQEDDGNSLDLACHHVQPVCLIAPGWALSEPMVRRLRAAGTKAVLAYLDEKPVGFVPTLTFEQAAVGRAGVGHLADLGHRRILALLPGGNDELSGLADRRLAGALEVAASRRLLVRPVRGEPMEVAEMLDPWFKKKRTYTAVFAFNDEYALLAIQQLVGRGLRVPDDVAVMGCDDSPAAALSSPPLSSVRFGGGSVGPIIADLVDRAVKGKPLPRHLALGAPTAVARESTQGDPAQLAVACPR